MKKAFLLFLLIISILLFGCSTFVTPDESSLPAEESVLSEEPSVVSAAEESSFESSEESSETSIGEESEEESEEPSEEISLPTDASELYLYAMSVIENSVNYTSSTESTFDLFQSDKPEPVLSYVATTDVRLQEVNERDKRLDFTTTLSVDGIESKSRLLYIDGVGYYDTDGEKTKQAMSFEKALEFLGSDGDTIVFTPDMFDSVTVEDMKSAWRIELTKIKDVSAASALVPDTMENGKIEDLRVTLYVNADGTPAAEVIGMKMSVGSDHKYISISCEVIQTTTFSAIDGTVIDCDIDKNEYTDGIIYRN